jgi:hypothetical protein
LLRIGHRRLPKFLLPAASFCPSRISKTTITLQTLRLRCPAAELRFREIQLGLVTVIICLNPFYNRITLSAPKFCACNFGPSFGPVQTFVSPFA